MQKQASGFTLIELVVTMVIIAILASISAPSFNSMIIGNRLSGEMNAIIGGLNIARSEAQKRGTTVSVCAGTDIACVTDWSAGWVVLLESDPKEQLLVRPTLTSGDTISVSLASEYPQFNAAGYTFYTGKIFLRDKSNTASLTRCIIFNAGSWVSKKGAACPTT
ncbi:GspH/FimT family pseudopilin [Massilia sp. TWP1-3-3]|uniref:GspH/FimT family pseudopilin n=1 Tax=Massilia sp. TWP1-3-3 TaxID=2804573 RepID=UPI003CEABFF4